MKHPFMPLLLADLATEETPSTIDLGDPLRSLAHVIRDVIDAIREVPVILDTGIPALRDYPTTR